MPMQRRLCALLASASLKLHPLTRYAKTAIRGIDTSAMGTTFTHAHTVSSNTMRNESPQLRSRAILRSSSPCSPSTRSKRRRLRIQFRGTLQDLARESDTGGAHVGCKSDEHPAVSSPYNLQGTAPAQSGTTEMGRHRHMRLEVLSRAGDKVEESGNRSTWMREEKSKIGDSFDEKSINPHLLARASSIQSLGYPAFKAAPTMFSPSPQLRASTSISIFTDSPQNVECVPLSNSTNIVQCTSDESSSPPQGKLSSSNSASSGHNSGDDNNNGAGGSSSNPKKMQDGQEANSGENGRNPNDEGAVEAASEDILETHTPLSYQIPVESLRTAMQASDTSLARYYSHALYRGPEDQKLSLHYCQTKEVAERVAKYFLEEKVVGFDIEWNPFAPPSSIKGNASLIQLACEDRIALFHISLFKGYTAEQLLPQSLKEIMESPDILKVGVNIKGDFTRLERYLGVKPQGKYELSRLHNVVEYTLTDPSKVNNKLVSLANQVHQHLLLPLHKGEVRESDWSHKLNQEQLSYAFTDAYAGFRLFDAMEAKRKMLRPIPPRPPVTDFDPVPKLRDGPRPKRVKKVTQSKAVAASEKETGVEQDVDEDEEDEYETAVEELPESDGDEESSPSQSSFESSELSDDPDGDYEARIRHVGHVPTNTNGVADESKSIGRRVGRLHLAQSVISDPGYPKLPVDSSDDEADIQNSGVHLQDENERDPVSFTSDPDEGISGAQEVDLVPEAVPEIDDFDMPSDEEKEMAAIVAKLEITGESPGDVDIVSTYTFQQGEQPAINSHVPKASGKNKAEEPEQDADAAAGTRPYRSVQFRPVQPMDDIPRTHEYTLADTWANEYLVSSIPAPSITSGFSRIRATLPHLRAYHLWHHQGLQVSEVARHLRDPPLSENTVCGYILQAVNMEKLECDKQRGKEVLVMLPLSVRMSRFRGLSERFNQAK